VIRVPAGLRTWANDVGGGLPRTFWVLWAGMFVNRIGTFVVPFLAVYLTQARHLPIATAGFMAALYGAGSVVASPLGGYLADHAGRRTTMVAALGLGGASMIALGFVQRLEILAPACFLVAMIGECYRPALQAAVADIVPMRDRVRAFGVLYWVINLGVAIGLTFAGFLATRSFVWLFVGDGLSSLVFAAIVWRAVPETRPARAEHEARPHGLVRGFLAPYRDRPFLAFLALNTLVFLVFMQHATALPIEMANHGVPRTAMGAVLAVNGFLIVLLQPLLAPWMARHDRSRLIAAGAALLGVGFGMNALLSTAPGYGAGVALWSVGEIGLLPVANAVVADVALPDLRGRYQGAHGLTFSTALCLGPLIGTAALQYAGGTVLWLGCLVVGLAVAAGHLALRPALARLRDARSAAPPAAAGH
jgi:MFS family permease